MFGNWSWVMAFQLLGPCVLNSCLQGRAKTLLGVLSCCLNRQNVSYCGSNSSPGPFITILFKNRACSYWSRFPCICFKSSIKSLPMIYLFIKQINKNKFWFSLVQWRYSGSCVLDQLVTSALLWWYQQFIRRDHRLDSPGILNWKSSANALYTCVPSNIYLP